MSLNISKAAAALRATIEELDLRPRYKPGDRVRVTHLEPLPDPLKWCPTKKGENVAVGSTLTVVEDPNPVPWLWESSIKSLPAHLQDAKMLWYDSAYGPAVYPEACVEPAAPPVCTCDLRRLMTSGCGCEAMKAEREARRGREAMP